MKHTVRILFFLLTLFFLCAGAFQSCAKKPAESAEEEAIGTPENLRVEESVIYWDAVENATEYTVEIGGNSYVTKENSFDAFALFVKERTYIVRVCAKNSRESSEWSDALTHHMHSDVEWEYRPVNDSYEVSVARDKTPRGIALIPTVHPIDQKPISSVGWSSFKNCSEITGVIVPEGMKKISGFEGCTGLRKVVLPEEMSFIDSNAFKNCTSLIWVKMPKKCGTIGVNAFAGCSSLQSIDLPEGLEHIKAGAFLDCTSLTEIIIPKTVTSIYTGVFSGCDSMRSITVAQGNPKYRSEKNCLIDRSRNAVLFGNRYSTIPIGVAIISEEAFAKSKGLTEIVLPSTVSRISNGAFYHCIDLRSVTFGENLKELGGSTDFSPLFASQRGVFEDCPLLTELRLPASVNRVAEDAFKGAPHLKKITVDPQNPVFLAEGNCLINKDRNYVVFGTEASVIPENVSGIGAYAFRDCDAGVIVIPRGVKYIGPYAFFGCDRLTVLLPDSVETINGSAFFNCGSVYTTAKQGETPEGWYFSTGKEYDYDWAYNTPVIYNCIFGEENGTVYLDRLTVTSLETEDKSTKKSLPAEILAPARTGYAFVGFATEQGGEAVCLPRDGRVLTVEEWEALAPDTVLFAVWKAKE